jgi:hypothetical protein
MSDPHDPWKALHARRARHASSRKARGLPSVPPVATPSRKPRAPAPSRIPEQRPASAPSSPKKLRPESRAQLPPSRPLDFSDTPNGPTTPSTTQGKERFLVSIDMVTEENRQAVRSAAESEGRKLSQWARRILLTAATGK